MIFKFKTMNDFEREIAATGEMRRLMLEYGEKIPFINFPSDWSVRLLPPFAGAVVRFCVKKGDNEVSVFLDCEQKLGLYGEDGKDPYWEIYPYIDSGDVIRCDMDDVDKLIELINESLNFEYE